MRILGRFVLILVTGLAYIRLAPVKVTLTKFPSAVGDYAVAGGFTAVREISGSVNAATVEAAMLALPRTVKVADAPPTFITRSRVFGFPDVTVVAEEAGHLVVSGNLVYGRGDLGVNRARILALLSAL